MPDSGGKLESSVGIPILKKEAILHINTFFFFPEVLLGENYKTFTVQCLQSQFVVNWFPKYITTQVDLTLLHSKYLLLSK